MVGICNDFEKAEDPGVGGVDSITLCCLSVGGEDLLREKTAAMAVVLCLL